MRLSPSSSSPSAFPSYTPSDRLSLYLSILMWVRRKKFTRNTEFGNTKLLRNDCTLTSSDHCTAPNSEEPTTEKAICIFAKKKRKENAMTAEREIKRVGCIARLIQRKSYSYETGKTLSDEAYLSLGVARERCSLSFSLFIYSVLVYNIATALPFLSRSFLERFGPLLAFADDRRRTLHDDVNARGECIGRPRYTTA